jgi:excisionase family DNA binding protein
MSNRPRFLSTDALLTCEEAARFLTLKPSTIRAWTSRRRIAFVKLASRAVRYRQADLEKIIKAGLRPALREAESEEGGAR